MFYISHFISSDFIHAHKFYFKYRKLYLTFQFWWYLLKPRDIFRLKYRLRKAMRCGSHMEHVCGLLHKPYADTSTRVFINTRVWTDPSTKSHFAGTKSHRFITRKENNRAFVRLTCSFYFIIQLYFIIQNSYIHWCETQCLDSTMTFAINQKMLNLYSTCVINLKSI